MFDFLKKLFSAPAPAGTEREETEEEHSPRRPVPPSPERINFIKEMRESIHNEDTPAAAQRAFREVCAHPVTEGTEQLLFECGTYSLTGEPKFYVTWERRYAESRHDEEYTRLHLDLLFPPDLGADTEDCSLWREDGEDSESFFRRIEESEVFRKLETVKAETVNIYTDMA